MKPIEEGVEQSESERSEKQGAHSDDEEAFGRSPEKVDLDSVDVKSDTK